MNLFSMNLFLRVDWLIPFFYCCWVCISACSSSVSLSFFIIMIHRGKRVRSKIGYSQPRKKRRCRETQRQRGKLGGSDHFSNAFSEDNYYNWSGLALMFVHTYSKIPTCHWVTFSILILSLGHSRNRFPLLRQWRARVVMLPLSSVNSCWQQQTTVRFLLHTIYHWI